MFEALILYCGLAWRFGATLGQLSYSWLDSCIERLEHRFGPRTWAMILAAILMIAAAIYSRPAIHTSALGTAYAQLASNPFGTAPNPVGYRILTPLISYCIGLRGELIIVTNLLFAGLFIFLIYRYFRKVSPRPGDAFLAAATITFSLVTLTTLYYGGYCDSLTYLIIFLMWRTRKRAVLFYLLLFLGLVNRESIAFLIPWFAFLTYQEATSNRRWMIESVIGLSLSLGLYLVFRESMMAGRTVMYSSDFYLKPMLSDPLIWIRRSVLNWPIGLFSVFKLMWAAVVVAAVALWQEGRRREVSSFILLLLCAGTQLAVAYDTSRLLTMGFMVMILSLDYLFKENAGGFRKWAGWVLLGSLAVPPLYTTSEHIIVMQPLIFNLIASHVSTSIH